MGLFGPSKAEKANAEAARKQLLASEQKDLKRLERNLRTNAPASVNPRGGFTNRDFWRHEIATTKQNIRYLGG